MSSVAVSAVIITSTGGAGIIPLLVFAGVMALAAGMNAVGNHVNERAAHDALASRAQTDAERIRGRIGEMEDTEDSKKFLRALDETEQSLAAAGSDYDALRAVSETLRELSIKMNKSEIEASQRQKRTAAVANAIAEVKAFGQFSELEQLERIKLERIEDALARINETGAEDRMTELQRMLDELIDVKNTRERRATYPGENVTVFSPKPQKEEIGMEERDRLIVEIHDLASRIADLDEMEGERLAPTLARLSADTRFPERLRSIKRQIKTTLGAVIERAAASAYFRGVLSELRGELEKAREAIKSDEAAKLAARCGTLCGGRYIERADFMKLYEDIAKFAAENGENIVDSLLAGKVKEELESMGYELVGDEIEPGSVHYLETPYDGYRVMAKIDEKGSLTTRLVRVIDEDEPALEIPGQAALDREAGEKWCRDFDKFLSNMNDAGLPLDVTLRKEPDETELITVPVKNARKRAKKSSRRRGTEEKLTRARGDDEA